MVSGGKVKCNKGDVEKQCRSFKIVGSGIGYVSPPTSYYKGKEPMNAANKFGSMLFRLINDKKSAYYKFNKQNTIKMIMRETTRGSSKATYYYKVERHELPKPIERTLPNGTKIVNKYKIKTHKCPADEDQEMKGIENKVNTQTTKKTKTVAPKKAPVKKAPAKKAPAKKNVKVDEVNVKVDSVPL
jgi:hypothetical protein